VGHGGALRSRSSRSRTVSSSCFDDRDEAERAESSGEELSPPACAAVDLDTPQGYKCTMRENDHDSGHLVAGHAARDGHTGHPGHGHRGHAGHGGHGDHGAQFRDTFWLSVVLSVPVVFFSPMFADLLGHDVPRFTGADWIAPLLGPVVFVYGG